MAFVASQWQLMWWKFIRHKMAAVAGIIILLFYLSALFAEFVAPYDPRQTDKLRIHLPPQRLYLVDESGRFHIQPFAYNMKKELDMETLKQTYSRDSDIKYRLRFFVKGDPYKLFGLFEGNLHLFGTAEGRIYLLGGDKMGRDLLSRIVYGTRISLSIGLVGIAISFILGIVIGGISGYFGGMADTIIQRVIEFLRSIPPLPLWLGLSAALPRLHAGQMHSCGAPLVEYRTRSSGPLPVVRLRSLYGETN